MSCLGTTLGAWVSSARSKKEEEQPALPIRIPGSNHFWFCHHPGGSKFSFSCISGEVCASGERAGDGCRLFSALDVVLQFRVTFLDLELLEYLVFPVVGECWCFKIRILFVCLFVQKQPKCSKISYETLLPMRWALSSHELCIYEIFKYLKNVNPGKDDHTVQKEVGS